LTHYSSSETGMLSALLLNLADFSLFSLAAFFGPGKYIIPEDKDQLAVQSFSPIIDSLINFSNRYSTVNRTATLVILGFADGAGFDTTSELYDTLITLAGKSEATKQELNQKLSELRAKELIKKLTTSFLQKAGSFQDPDKLKIEYLGQGKGEEFPLTSIKNYQDDDERRRIVLCYWVVLPD
jgi:outer membrane protein OmpA-like peptidoglycan-associated protein